MFRKQIATDRVNRSKNLTPHTNLINNVAQKTNDPENFYDWLIKADEKVILDWIDDAQRRDDHGYKEK